MKRQRGYERDCICTSGTKSVQTTCQEWLERERQRQVILSAPVRKRNERKKKRIEKEKKVKKERKREGNSGKENGETLATSVRLKAPTVAKSRHLTS